MKIVIIGTTASSIYIFRVDLITALIKKGHIVYAFTCEYTNDELKKIESTGAIPVTYKLNRGGINPLADIYSTYTLAKKIKIIAPDMVFSYFSKPVIFGTLAAKIAKVPRIFGMIEGLGFAFTQQPGGINNKTRLIKKAQLLLYKTALPNLDKLIFLNNDDRRDLLEANAISVKNVAVLGGIGLNLDQYPYYPVVNSKSAISFLFIGRLLKEKGIHDFIAAAKIVKAQYPMTQFNMLGAVDNSNLGALGQMELDTLIASKIINYLGYVSHVQDSIASSDVFVLPSYREGVPRSTQEAMAMGRAVITTDVPGCRETVINGVNGFLVEKWNPQALADKMIYFIEHPEQIEKMGYESYKIAQEKFDANEVNKRLINMMGL